MSTMIAEVYDTLKELHKKMDVGFSEVQIKFSQLEGEMQTRFAHIEGEMQTKFAHIEGEIRLLKWMLGLVLAGILSLILKTFFM